MIQEELTNAIIGIINENGNEVIYKEAKIELAVVKYSQLKTPTNTLFIDGRNIKRNSNYKVRYQCTCGHINEILLCKYLTKKHLNCVKCKETQEKRKWHSEVLRKIYRGEGYESKNKRSKRTYNFDNETEEYKQWYYENFLKVEEFNSIKKHIYSVNGIVVENKDFELLPHEPGMNGTKYRQMILVNGDKIPLKNIKLRCDYCGSIFSITRKLKQRYQSNNFDCRECYLINKKFKPVIINQSLRYQGQKEFQFIKRCEENGINIINGPKVNYFFNGKNHKYSVDFELPELKTFVEIKDNHIWHKKQVESGKWPAKENAARKYAKDNGYKYYLLFPKDIDKFFQETVRDSLTNSESC